MKKQWWLILSLGILLVLSVTSLAGCSGPAAAQGTVTPVQINQQQQGIWVNGSGEVMVNPDIAMLRVGITSQDASVASAQSRASEAMSKVMKALADNGVAQKDIQTGSYNISQRTRWDDPKQTDVVIGYQVTNLLTVKIRDTGKAGAIIDAAVQAGGDLIRISGISFSVENPVNAYQQAREKAMADAKSQAEQLARLAGVAIGKPNYIVENSQSTPVYDSYRSAGIGMSVPAPAIAAPISPGESRIVINVQVCYAIVQ